MSGQEIAVVAAAASFLAICGAWTFKQTDKMGKVILLAFVALLLACLGCIMVR